MTRLRELNEIPRLVKHSDLKFDVPATDSDFVYQSTASKGGMYGLPAEVRIRHNAIIVSRGNPFAFRSQSESIRQLGRNAIFVHLRWKPPWVPDQLVIRSNTETVLVPLKYGTRERVQDELLRRGFELSEVVLPYFLLLFPAKLSARIEEFSPFLPNT